ncbi:MAG: hypothetical protein JWN71_504 [Xanthobacteraceae bacterium]|nr:hypothetical protein [Xanthobacteraceae bacterium]
MRTATTKARAAPLFGHASPAAVRPMHRIPEVRAILRTPQVQPKLTIGAVNDPAEHEADRVADRVMRTPEPQIATVAAPRGVQRTCATCEPQANHEDRKSGARLDDTDGELKAKAEPSGGPTTHVPPGFGAKFQALQSGGQGLSASERGFFEPRLASHFSGVRVHTGPAAGELARSVQARAFTLGNSVVFGAGQYSPGTDTGRRLMAHELTHVVQQGGAATGANVVQRVVDFTASFANISLTQGAGATIGGSNFTYHDANFSADITITATGDSVAELNEWDVGTLQDLIGHWDRYYWQRQNADRLARFVEKKYRPVNTRLRDQVNGTASDWYADSIHQPLNGLANTPVGARFRASTTLTHQDVPGGPETVDGSAQPGMDATDGTRNIDIERSGARFETWASAHNTTTGEWRHIRFLNWNYQRSLDFSGSGGTLAVANETWQLGRHGPHAGGAAAPLIAGTTYNTNLNDPAENPARRVNGWT